MRWNNGYERKKFEARQKKQAEEYRALGMTEEQIKEMYEYDLEQFKSDRRYAMHTQSIQEPEFDDIDADESDNSLLKEFFDQLTCNIDDSTEKPRYWWIEEIENPQIARKMKTLSHIDLEIITLMVIDECKHEEIARIMGVSVRTIERKKAMYKKIFSEY